MTRIQDTLNDARVFGEFMRSAGIVTLVGFGLLISLSLNVAQFYVRRTDQYTNTIAQIERGIDQAGAEAYTDERFELHVKFGPHQGVTEELADAKLDRELIKNDVAHIRKEVSKIVRQLDKK